MMWSFALLFYLVFAVASGEPEPNVNVKININVNGESEESQESGVSCNLVWNVEDYRPLIMVRETKTIVPPVDTAISKDPNRIPIGVKLVFACAGQDNSFNHFVGNQTKLHGECVAENQFKVCFNNSPVHLDLSELSCSKQLFPSFIKQDNAASDKKSCDGLGEELYKQGYTYGDYHEFKDLEIEVCFKKNQTSICTSPNLNGNETDYTRTAQGFKELRGSGARGVDNCGATKKCTDKQETGGDKPYCVAEVVGKGVKCEECDVKPLFGSQKTKLCASKKCGCCVPKGNPIVCGTPKEPCNKEGKFTESKVECSDDQNKCKKKKEDGGIFPTGGKLDTRNSKFCNHKNCGCCIEKNTCLSQQFGKETFTKKHVCPDCKTTEGALEWIKKNTDRNLNIQNKEGNYIPKSTVFSNVGSKIKFKQGDSGNICTIVDKVDTWECKHDGAPEGSRKWFKCSESQKCVGSYDENKYGHFDENTLDPPECHRWIYV